MIAVLSWCDGFGNDTCVMGICESKDVAQKIFKSTYGEHETRYQEIDLNTECFLDYYEAKPLFDKNTSKRKKKKVDKTPLV